MFKPITKHLQQCINRLMLITLTKEKKIIY